MSEGFRRRVTALVEERGTSVTALARKCKIPVATLHSWMNGAVPSKFDAVQCLAKELGVSFCYLLTGSEESAARTRTPDLEDLVDKEHLFDGYMEVSIRRLIPKTRR